MRGRTVGHLLYVACWEWGETVCVVCWVVNKWKFTFYNKVTVFYCDYQSSIKEDAGNRGSGDTGRAVYSAGPGQKY